MKRSPKNLVVSREKFRRMRAMILKNMREHCRQAYKPGSPGCRACEGASVLAVAEFTDVAEKLLGVKLD